MSITFVIPGPPQGKGRPRATAFNGRARMYTPAKTLAYEGLVAIAAQQAMAGAALLEGPVQVKLSLWCQVPASWSKRKQQQAYDGAIRPTTKPDIDNVVKAIFDGCNGVLWRDDVQVVDLSLSKLYSRTPAVVVAVEAAS